MEVYNVFAGELRKAGRVPDRILENDVSRSLLPEALVALNKLGHNSLTILFTFVQEKHPDLLANYACKWIFFVIFSRLVRFVFVRTMMHDESSGNVHFFTTIKLTDKLPGSVAVQGGLYPRFRHLRCSLRDNYILSRRKFFTRQREKSLPLEQSSLST